MHRRTLLVSLGAVGLAGCLGDSGSSAPGASADESTGTPTPETATPTPIDAAEALSIERRGIVTAESNAEDDNAEFAAARVENTSTQSIGKVIVSAEWLDGDGNVAATTSEWLFAFEPGAVWEAYVPAEDGVRPEDVTIGVEAEPRTVAAGPLSAADEAMTLHDGAAVLGGTVTNEGTEDVFPTVFGKFRDDAGTIVGGATAPLNNVPAEDSVSFELSLPVEGTPRSEPVEYDLVLDTPDGAGCLC
jgi:hypothetical protein